MLRSQQGELFPFDAEIERTLHRRRREHRMALNNEEERTLRSYIMPTTQGIIRSIVPPPVTVNHFEIRPALITMIQNSLQFSGLPSEDPNQHLAKFLNICNTFKVADVPDDAVTLRVFPFSLRDRAWNWLDSLPPNSITSWDQLVSKFLEKYFPPSKTGQLRNEITNFKQFEGESLYEAWERMKDLLRRCPHHGLPREVTLQTFYQGTRPDIKYHLDAASGGALMNLTYTAAYEKIEDMALNTSHNYGGERSIVRKPAGVLEVDSSNAYMARIEASLRDLTKQMKSMQVGPAAMNFVGNPSQCTPYGEYSGDGAEQFQEGSVGQEAVNYVSNGQFNNPYSNTYNPGWRNHPNFRWGNTQGAPQQMNQQAPPGFQNQQMNRPYQGGHQQQPTLNSGEPKPSMEAMFEEYMKSQALTNQQLAASYQQQQASIRNLEMQIGQLSQQLASRPQGTLPGGTENNPKGERIEHCKAINLRSGRTLPEVDMHETPHSEESQDDNRVEAEGEKNEEAINQEGRGPPKTPYWSVWKPTLPFPNRQRRCNGGTRPDEPIEKKVEDKVLEENPHPPVKQSSGALETRKEKKKKLDIQFEKFLDIFKKLQINIPFAEALSQMPTYLKFMKEILSKKRKLEDKETIALTEYCSAVLTRSMPQKCKDPGSFDLPFTLGNYYSGMALCDLGASINLMSLSLCRRLGLHDPRFLKLCDTSSKLRMADQSIKRPTGLLEDVLVKVGKFILPADFVVLDMEDEADDTILFGRPFLATARAKIDVEEGKLTLRVQDEKETFHVLQRVEHEGKLYDCKLISIREEVHPTAMDQPPEEHEGKKSFGKRTGEKVKRWIKAKEDERGKERIQAHYGEYSVEESGDMLEWFKDYW